MSHLFRKSVISAALLAGALTSTAQAQHPLRGIVAGASAYVPRPATLIVPARVASVAVSPVGPYALISRQDDLTSAVNPLRTAPAGGAALILWGSGTREASTLWQQAASPDETTRGVVRTMAWLPGTNTALAVVGTEPLSLRDGQPAPPRGYSLLLISAEGATARTLTTGPATLRLSVSPTTPTALLTEVLKNEQGQTEAQTQVVSARGTLGPVLPLDPHATVSVQWAADGRTAQVCLTPSGGGSPTPPAQWFTVDPATSKVTPLDKAPAVPNSAPPAAPTLPLQIVSATGSVSQGRTAQAIHPLWLVGQDKSAPPVLLNPDAERGVLLPDLSAALYVADGSLYAVPLMRTTAEAFQRALTEQQRTTAMANAYQVGHALLAYAGQNGGSLPSGGDPAGALSPFVSGDDVFNNPATGLPGFSLAAGGSLSGMANPGGTVIGYLNGPNGRAAIYGDGTIRWQP